MSNKTFIANGILTGGITKESTELFVYVGLVTQAGVTVSEDFGSGGTLLIGKLAADGGVNVIPLKRITGLSSDSAKASRYILPAGQTPVVILSGSTSPDLYVEMQTGPRRNP